MHKLSRMLDIELTSLFLLVKETETIEGKSEYYEKLLAEYMKLARLKRILEAFRI